jgi:acyl carrier protein
MNVNSSNQTDVILFVSDQLSIPIEKINLNQSLFHDLGVDGDDAIELIEKYALKFHVAINEFNFDEHFGQEGAPSPLAFIIEFLFRKNYKQKKRFTVADLVRGVGSGKI